MRVTFCTRYDGFLWRGGAETQAEQTAIALRQQGIEVEFFTPFSEHVGDIVHFFGLYEHYIPVAEYCRSRHIPIIVSTIFYHSIDTLSHLYRALRWVILSRVGRLPHKRFRLLHLADVLLPNSQAEAWQLRKLFNIPPEKIHVIPNGVELRFAQSDPSCFREKYQIDTDFILNVGRIEKRKNQLRLIEAVRSLGIPLVIIGNPASNDYYLRCNRIKDEQTIFIPHIEHTDPLLASAYAACRVFALPSLLETPGIAALEAGLSGARLVVTPIGGAREYFRDYATYVNPRSVKSIRDSIATAWNRTHNPEQQIEHLKQFSWHNVTVQTASIYQEVLRQ
jgi:glycosyltransferase involved in cell wall biosynthesis